MQITIAQNVPTAVGHAMWRADQPLKSLNDSNFGVMTNL